MTFSISDLIPAYAEIWLLVMAAVILLVDPFLPERRRDFSYLLALLTLFGAAFFTAVSGYLTGMQPTYAFERMFVADYMGHMLKMFTYLSVAACLVHSRTYLQERGLYRGEYFVLALFATLGINVMISANHFVSLYLGLELMSLCLYALVALNRDSATSTEAAMKYFVLGALSSGMLLYGISMLYGATGTLEITGVARAVGNNVPNQTILLFGLVFVVSGIAFKLGVAPFHMWIPDVYHGAPTPVTLMVGAAPKLAAFAIMVRLLVGGLIGVAADWQQMLIILAVLSMAIGNLGAIAQTNVKRMLAYSTISHMGFMLLGLASGVVDGNRLNAGDAYGSSLFYIITYTLTTLASFGMILLLTRQGFEAETLEDFKGLNTRSPWFAAMMLIVMFSLAGLPPTVGFYAKLAVLQAAVSANMVWLAVVAVMFSLIGAFYYLRVVKLMYFDEPLDTKPIVADTGSRVVLSANGVLLLLLGLLPGALMAVCVAAMRTSI